MVMRRAVLALTLAVSLLAGRAPVHAEDLSFTFFGDYLESLRRQAGIPGLSAVVVGSSDVLWSRAFGTQNVEKNIAMRTDTPVQLDGLTQVMTASIVLSCTVDGTLSLSDRVGKFAPDSPDANATLAQLMSHTSGSADGSTFEYRLDRLQPLARAIEYCGGRSYRSTVANLMDILAMMASVPGADAPAQTPPDPMIVERDLARYTDVLQRLATFYSVDKSGRAAPTPHPALTLTASSGLIGSADDLAKFDLALKRGIVAPAEQLALAWRNPTTPAGQPLPHGYGWFVQNYNGSRVVWQYGMTDGASSSLMITVLPRGLTLILTANSDGLAKGFGLPAGDVTASPFGKVFLGTFVR
jgi:CubicO group peptidase (beta-lactamase class C family)